ncbi:hypothetical protein AAJ76_2480001203 [Vairimorpha ceranae]|uniref:ISXO2-like transposase domain-containing protein n=1 Tax=Vairimorpha ceranae TaxID=40302 RepID=A0A0F9Z769_9MICR|nr:hypothetical protein AAJ76_2480001203 [Vairimorpha ceranae]KKO73759.1 hypothetical protein AAJ76_2480001203 [Vairimorpha ceranae]
MSVCCKNFKLWDHIINHTEGFRSEDGSHTNNIEGFWGHMKGTIRKKMAFFVTMLTPS